MRTVPLPTLAAAVAVGLCFASVQASGQERGRYELMIFNTNTGQNFSPPVVVLHREGFRLFELGEPASAALAQLAEDGATGGLRALAEKEPEVIEVLIGPSVHRRRSPIVEMTFDAPPGAKLTLAAMLTLTNDGFTAARAIALPARPGQEVFVALLAYDAGSEANTESCAHVPCETHGVRMTVGAEGVVQEHPGIRGDRDIPLRRGWEDPEVGRLALRRVE